MRYIKLQQHRSLYRHGFFLTITNLSLKYLPLTLSGYCMLPKFACYESHIITPCVPPPLLCSLSAPESQPQCDLHPRLAAEGRFERRKRGKIPVKQFLIWPLDSSGGFMTRFSSGAGEIDALSAHSSLSFCECE